MTAPEVFKRINQMVSLLGGSGNVLLVCAGRPESRLPRSIDGHCRCCGAPVVFIRENLEKIIAERNMQHYLTFCLDCMEKSMSQDHDSYCVPNTFAAKEFGVSQSVVRDIEKKLSEKYGCTYEDPLQNN